MSVLPFPKSTSGPTPPPATGVSRVTGWGDPELMGRLLAGDAAAFDQIIQLFWSSLTGYASRILDDEEAAQDVVHSVLIRLWERRAELRPGSLRGYLLRLTRNAALDELKRRRVRQRSTLWFDLDGLSRPTPTPADLVAEHELSSAIDRAIQALPPRRREVFTLVHLRGLSYREAAALLDISVKTVGNQLTTALAELRVALQPLLAEPDQNPERRPRFSENHPR